MNSNWRNRPTTIDYIPKNIDFLVSIDESGNANLKNVLKVKNSNGEVVDNERHFTVTACSIPMSEFENARDMVMTLKRKYWPEALYCYAGIMKRVCFHSREIRGRQNAFSPNQIDYDSFILELSQLISDVPMTLYASHIDKLRHVNQYAYPDSPYDLCMTFVIERIMRDIPSDATCIIALESRGNKEDKKVLNHIKNLIDFGNRYNDKSIFQKIKGVYFNPKWCHIADDQMSYWALELADLCAYPINKYFTYGKRDRAFMTLLPKVSCYPNVNGKGLKSFP